MSTDRSARLRTIVLGALVLLVDQPVLAAPGAGSVEPEPAAEIRVEIRVDPSGTPPVTGRLVYPAAPLRGSRSLEVVFPDLARMPELLRSLSARSEDVELEVEKPEGGSATVRRILRGDTEGPVEVRYAVDPTYYPPNVRERRPGLAVGKVEPSLGVVRTTSVLPATEPLGPPMAVRFTLPEGWEAVTPWEQRGRDHVVPAPLLTTVEYLGFGRFASETVAADGVKILIATARSGRTLPRGAVRRLLEEILGVVGTPPPGAGDRVVMVVPGTFLEIGTTGTYTTVQPPAPSLLAHEMLHWWNRSDLTTEDAHWFQEGVSTFYGIAFSHRSGAWEDAEVDACLADIEAEVDALEEDPPMPLADLRVARGRRHVRLIYSKGALVTARLDRLVRAEGSSLDPYLRAVVTSGSTGLDSERLVEIFRQVHGGPAARELSEYVLQGRSVPDMGLPPPTGRSGCAVGEP